MDDPATIESRSELDDFVEELREVGDRIFGKER